MGLLVTDQVPRVQYVAAAAQTIFPVPFLFLANSDIVVDINGTVKALTVDYNLADAGVEAGGTCTLTSGASADDVVTIYRDMPLERRTDYNPAGDFAADDLDTELIRLLLMIQQQQRDAERTFRFGPLVDEVSEPFSLNVADRAGKALVFDADGDLAVTTISGAADPSLRADLAASTGAQLIGWKQAGTGATARTARDKMRELAVAVTDFGADPTGAADSTAAFNFAKAVADVVCVPEGDFLVDEYTLDAANGALLTAGKATRLIQNTGNAGVPIITIKAPNVMLGDLRFKGNIATDPDEFNHCIAVQDEDGLVPEIRDISLGSYEAKDIRGDIVYFGGTPASKVFGVTFGSITGDNIYRSGVSFVGGQHIRGERVAPIGNTGRFGYKMVDFEPNAAGANQAVDDIYIGTVRGGQVQCVSADLGNPTGRVRIGFCDLDPAYQTNTTPARPGFAGDEGILVHTFKHLQIDLLKTNNHTFVPLHSPVVVGASRGIIEIGHWQAANCDTADAVYTCYAYIGGAERLIVNSVDVVLPNNTKFFVRGEVAPADLSYCEIGNGTINGGGLCTAVTRPHFRSVKATVVSAPYMCLLSDGAILESCDISQTGGGAVALTRQCNNFLVKHSTVVAPLWETVTNNGKIERSSLNGTFVNDFNLGPASNGTFALAAAATTVVNNANVTAASIIQVFPTNAAAAALMAGASSLYIFARNAGVSFTVKTADAAAAAGTETFNYVILN